jgi:hypothetical protein
MSGRIHTQFLPSCDLELRFVGFYLERVEYVEVCRWWKRERGVIGEQTYLLRYSSLKYRITYLKSYWFSVFHVSSLFGWVEGHEARDWKSD